MILSIMERCTESTNTCILSSLAVVSTINLMDINCLPLFFFLFSILFFFTTVNALSHYSARKLAIALKPVKNVWGQPKKKPDFAWLKKIAFQRYTVSQKRLKRLQKFSNITGSRDKDLANKQPNLPFILSMEDHWPHTNILKPTLWGGLLNQLVVRECQPNWQRMWAGFCCTLDLMRKGCYGVRVETDMGIWVLAWSAYSNKF